jgi:formylglycine-generating enzyme required for sulfatase activity
MGKRRHLYIVTAILIAAPFAKAAPMLCKNIFTPAKSNNQDSIQTLQPTTAPFESQFTEQKLSIDRAIESLAQLQLTLDLAEINGLKSAHLSALAHAYSIKERQLIEYLEKYKLMTRDELLARMRHFTEQEQKPRQNQADEEVKREKQKREIEASVIDGSRLIMNSIEPGAFEMGEMGAQKLTTISQSFEMAATQTTQIVWQKVVEAAKAKFPGEFDSLNPNPSSFPGDLNPVESISYEDIHLWLTAVNKLIAESDPVIAEIMPGTKKGSQLRLPTEAEWEFVARARGAAKGLYHFGENESDLGAYGWYLANSGSKTHPVAEKKPLVIDGKEFYDLHGNVCEWVNDWYDANLQGGVDPKGPATGSGRVFRGGSWNYFALYLRSADRYNVGPGNRYDVVGFRLVRTAP